MESRYALSALLWVFCNTTGHIQLVSVDGGAYQDCAGGDCWITMANSTTIWLPCNQSTANAAEIAEEIADELQKYTDFKPLSEERINSITINSSTYMKDSWMSWAENTLMPNIAAQDKTKGDLDNCTWKLREAEMSRQNIIDKHQPEIQGYKDRIEGLESENVWYGRFMIGGILLVVLFLLKEKGILSRKVFDKTKRKRY
jgi:hypothetical protein